jgi:hypothetical protein
MYFQHWVWNCPRGLVVGLPGQGRIFAGISRAQARAGPLLNPGGRESH